MKTNIHPVCGSLVGGPHLLMSDLQKIAVINTRPPAKIILIGRITMQYRILRLLERATAEGRELSAAEICEALNFSKSETSLSKVHLRRLQAHGLIKWRMERDEHCKQGFQVYSLGPDFTPEIFEWGHKQMIIQA